MSKKLFQKLIKKTSTPAPKEHDKQLHPDGYIGMKTRSDKSEDTSVKQSDKSHQSHVSTAAENPR